MYTVNTTINTATDTFMHNKRIVFNVTKYVFFSLLCVYFGAILIISFSVVTHKTINNQIKTARTDVGTLELSYLNTTNSIDKDYVLSHGYVPAVSSFASTDAGVSFLSMRTNAQN